MHVDPIWVLPDIVWLNAIEKSFIGFQLTGV